MNEYDEDGNLLDPIKANSNRELHEDEKGLARLKRASWEGFKWVVPGGSLADTFVDQDSAGDLYFTKPKVREAIHPGLQLVGQKFMSEFGTINQKIPQVNTAESKQHIMENILGPSDESAIVPSGQKLIQGNLPINVLKDRLVNISKNKTHLNIFLARRKNQQPPINSGFHQLALDLNPKETFNQLSFNLNQTQPSTLSPNSPVTAGLTLQEIEDAGYVFERYSRKISEKFNENSIIKAFDSLGIPHELIEGYRADVAEHEGALIKLRTLMESVKSDKNPLGTGLAWDRQHAKALRQLHDSGNMLGNVGLFRAVDYKDKLDHSAIGGKSDISITRKGNRPDWKGEGAQFQDTLSRILGKPLNLTESVLYWYDQDVFYFYRELSPKQRQQLVDISRTKTGGKRKYNLVALLEEGLANMEFGKENMKGEIGREITKQEQFEAVVSQAYAFLKKKYPGLGPHTPRQGNIFYDINK